MYCLQASYAAYYYCALSQAEQIKITDFGFATTKMNSASLQPPVKQVGTAAWMAPELFADDAAARGQGKKVDVYAFAIVMWELGAWAKPYKYNNIEQIKYLTPDGTRPELGGANLSAMPPAFSELMQRCWVKTCDARTLRAVPV